MKMHIQSFRGADAYLGSKSERPLPGRSTRLERRGPDSIAVRYHATDVVTYHADGRVTLNSNGFRTATTKARINEFSPVRLYQAKGLWYVDGGAIFEDGATLQDGTLSGVSEPASVEKRKRALDRKVSSYIKGFCASVAAAKRLDDPSGGDCWGCAMRPTDDPTREAMGFDHYLGHFGGTEDQPEPYFVPSLVVTAIKVRGYKEPGFIWHLIQGEAARGESRMLGEVLRAFFRKIKPALLAAS